MDRKYKVDFFKYCLIWILAAVIGCFFRLYPLLHFTTGDTTDKATLYVLNYLKTKVTDQVNHSFPDLSATQKEIVIKKQFDELLHQEKQNVRSSIDQVSRNMQQAAAPERTTPYLLESDPFYFYQLTENIVATGKMSDTIKGSKYLNKLMLAPQGHWEPFNLNPYIGFFIYKIILMFNPNVSLMYAVSFTPLVVTVLALIPFLLIC